MALIPINEKWRIKSDEYCWKIHRFSHIAKKDGEEVWNVEGYYPTLAGAANALIWMQARRLDTENFPELSRKILELVAEVEQALKLPEIPDFDPKLDLGDAAGEKRHREAV